MDLWGLLDTEMLLVLGGVVIFVIVGAIITLAYMDGPDRSERLDRPGKRGRRS